MQELTPNAPWNMQRERVRIFPVPEDHFAEAATGRLNFGNSIQPFVIQARHLEKEYRILFGIRPAGDAFALYVLAGSAVAGEFCCTWTRVHDSDCFHVLRNRSDVNSAVPTRGGGPDATQDVKHKLEVVLQERLIELKDSLLWAGQ